MTGHLSRLHKFIVDTHDKEELDDLCTRLGVRYDDLDGARVSVKARELILCLGRRGQLDRLLAELSRARPDVFNLDTDPTPLYADLPTWEDKTPLYTTHSPFPTPRPSLHQLPAPPSDFVGRNAELAELRAALQQGSTAIIGLRGIGGVGKTALALKLAHELKPRYPDAQLYLDLRGTSPQPLTPAEALAHVIHAYHPTARLPDDLVQLQNIYRSTLYGQRALLLLDDAAGREQIAPLLPPLDYTLLVTSRWRFTLPGLQVIDLYALPLPDARALLVAIAPRLAAAENVTDAIARLCGRLPLALRAAASLLAVQIDLSPTRYAAQLQDEHTRLQRIGDEGVDVSVKASLGLSYAALDEETARVFSALSVFPATFDALAAETVCHDENHTRLSTLLRYSLVNYAAPDDETEAGRYYIHDLARIFAASRLDDDERAALQLRHAVYYHNVLRTTNALYTQGGESTTPGLVLFELEWPNIQAGQAWTAAHAPQDDAAAALCDDYPNAGLYVFNLRQHPRQRILWLEAALAAARRLKQRGAESAHLGNLGVAYGNLGDNLRAIEFHQQHLDIAREIGDRRGEGNALGNLGNAYADLGDTRRAIELHQQHLDIACEINDYRGQGNALNNLGVAYVNLGKPSQAIELFELRLDIARKIDDRRGQGNALGNLGLAYADLGETRRAIEFHQQHLDIARELGDHQGQASALGNLANAYYLLGETRCAIEFYKQVLNIARELSDLRGQCKTLSNLGLIYHILGKTRRAIEFYQQHLDTAHEIDDRRGQCDALSNLGLAYKDLSEAHRSIEFYERALDIAREIDDLQTQGDTLLNLGLALNELGERAQAIARAQAALEIYEQIESSHADMVRKVLAAWNSE